ncbi:hypothetical protein IMZ48_21460 [Candidatus Bathyarchaeota archaeon]|nr:hypothetical protein [Candidatus Bathyarchaeota archaeon]
MEDSAFTSFKFMVNELWVFDMVVVEAGGCTGSGLGVEEEVGVYWGKVEITKAGETPI